MHFQPHMSIDKFIKVKNYPIHLRHKHEFMLYSKLEFLLKIKKGVNRSKHGCIFLKKRVFDLEALSESFEIGFQKDLLRTSFLFKRKIIFENNKTKKSRIPSKPKEGIKYKLKILAINQAKIMRVKANFHYFPMTLKN